MPFNVDVPDFPPALQLLLSLCPIHFLFTHSVSVCLLPVPSLSLHYLISFPFSLRRHPWTFIVTKGDTSSVVEDHAVYQGRNQFYIFDSNLILCNILKEGLTTFT